VLFVVTTACEALRDPAPSGTEWRPATGGHPVVVAAGDIACPGAAPCDPERSTAALIERMDAAAVLALGDTQYTDGTLAEYEASYDRSWGAFKDRTHPVPGNHEYRTVGAAGYFDYFGSRARTGDYGFDLGTWRLVAVDSAVDGAISGEQLDRVRSDLERSDRRCELAFWHHPRFSSGAVEGSDPVPELRALWTTLYEQGVDVVLNGHAHQYERFAPLDPEGNLDEAAGIREFVVGTGGGTPHPFEEEPVAGSRVRITDVHGVLELVLRPGSYSWRFVSVGGRVGRVLDHGPALVTGDGGSSAAVG
jgi:3',5'-cyclic AMP phosphodiesterase CpdA